MCLPWMKQSEFWQALFNCCGKAYNLLLRIVFGGKSIILFIVLCIKQLRLLIIRIRLLFGISSKVKISNKYVLLQGEQGKCLGEKRKFR